MTNHTMVPRWRRPSYGYLRNLIEQSLDQCPGFGGRVEVEGKIDRLGEGLWHDNYCFAIRGRGLPAPRREEAYILRLLQTRYDWQAGPEPRDRLVWEAQTLQALKQVDFVHPTPEFVCLVTSDESEPIGMIETALPGSSLDRFKDASTLRLIGRVAAALHRTAIEPFAHLPRRADRAEHAMAQLDEFDEALFAAFPLANRVRQWIEAHLPSGDRVCLLHGDLLPQNLLRDLPPSGCEHVPVGVIDWEMAEIGDPAHDLAIVSRGNRRVLGLKDGVRVLLEEYISSGGSPMTLADVRAHELILVLHWLEEAWHEREKPKPSSHRPDYYEGQLRALFQRAAEEDPGAGGRGLDR